MVSRRLFRWPCIAEMVICILGLVASLVPSVVYTFPIWGARGFIDRKPFSNDAPGVVITDIDAGSPLEAADLRPQDRIIQFNGKPIQFISFRQVLEKVEPEETITIDVNRDGRDVHLEYTGEKPKLEGVLFFNWQFATATAFFLLLLLLVATQPLMPPPLWRSILVTFAGLALAAVMIVIETTQFIPWSWIWQSMPIDHPPSPTQHFTLTGIVFLASLALSVLGALGIRSFLLSRRKQSVSP